MGLPYRVGGYDCSDDCSGHLAGWRWAAEQRVTEEHQCGGSRSESFSEGCHLYLEAIGQADSPY